MTDEPMIAAAPLQTSPLPAAPQQSSPPAATGRLGWRLQALLLMVAIRLRLPVTPTIALYRRVARALEDQTLVPAMAAFAPADVAETLDVPYGPAPAQRLDVFRPADAQRRLPALLWVHGGGWVAGTKDDLRSYLALLATEGMVTVGIDYTLAPELVYPGQLGQVAEAIAWIREHAAAYGIDPDRIVLAGDSAGAHIAAQVARAAQSPSYAADAQLTLPPLPADTLRAVVLTCGPYRMSEPTLSTPMGRISDLLLRAYTGSRRYATDARLGYASVLDHLDADFPPAFVTAGTTDPMLAGSRALAERLAELGVAVRPHFYPDDHQPDLPHEFHVDLRRPEAHETLAEIGAFVRRYADG